MDRLDRIFLIVIGVVGLVTIGLQVPSMQEQHGIAADRQAESDLRIISTAMTTYVLDEGDLPKSLSDISLTGETKDRLGNYEYKPGNNTYELCATFKTDTSKKGDSASDDSASDYAPSYNSYSEHKKGRQCFTEQANYNNYDYSSNSGSNAQDTEIKSDLTYIHTYLEVYYSGAGFYPTLAQLKDATWRADNMQGLIDSDVEGPNGETVGDGYTYTPSPAGCQTDCTSYTLSAQYSDGTTLTKKSL